jgi:hypothetical protein
VTLGFNIIGPGGAIGAPPAGFLRLRATPVGGGGDRTGSIEASLGFNPGANWPNNPYAQPAQPDPLGAWRSSGSSCGACLCAALLVALVGLILKWR